MTFIIPAALGLANIAMGAMGKSAHNRMANKFDSTRLTMPESVLMAQEIKEKLATQGLIGKESIIEDTRAMLPETVTQMKEISSSPSSIVGAISRASEATNKQIRDINVQDALMKAQNKSGLADFMTNKGRTEMQIQGYNNEMGLSAEAERMLGTKELLEGISSGIGGGVQTYADLEQLGYMKDYVNALSKSLG